MWSAALSNFDSFCVFPNVKISSVVILLVHRPLPFFILHIYFVSLVCLVFIAVTNAVNQNITLKCFQVIGDWKIDSQEYPVCQQIMAVLRNTNDCLLHLLRNSIQLFLQEMAIHRIVQLSMQCFSSILKSFWHLTVIPVIKVWMVVEMISFWQSWPVKMLREITWLSVINIMIFFSITFSCETYKYWQFLCYWITKGQHSFKGSPFLLTLKPFIDQQIFVVPALNLKYTCYIKASDTIKHKLMCQCLTQCLWETNAIKHF